MHSRKSYFKDFSASMKMITELIELYLVKLQFMVVIKIVHFVFFYQYSISFIYFILYLLIYYCIFYLCILCLYVFFLILSQHLFLVLFIYLVFSIFCYIPIFYWLFDNSLLGLSRSISFVSILHFMYIHSFIICYLHSYYYYHYFIIINNILFAILISYCFYFLVYSFGN